MDEDYEEDWTDSHWYWLTMYALGAGTGAMSLYIYQAYRYLY
jgi:hypothetical protein